MKKLLFIDHDFHSKTNSSDFFFDILKEKFEVERIFVKPCAGASLEFISEAYKYEYVLLWQMDFLAPVFVNMGKKTIVIPMYDASANAENLHWLYASKARFINFSLTLHWKIKNAGCESIYVKYFLPPVEENKRCKFDTLNAFFWQRRPEEQINFEFVANILGNDINSLHLHNVPDNPKMRTLYSNISETPYLFTQSEWFKDRGDYIDLLSKHNVFVCPRPSEGIGLAMLEAFSRGMVVIANDEPTHNEYIANWMNGILFNRFTSHEGIYLRFDAERLGHAAWLTAAAGYEEWMKSQADICNWIDTCPQPENVKVLQENVVRSLWEGYFSGSDSYNEALIANIGQLASASLSSLDQLFDAVGSVSIEMGAERPILVPFSGDVLDISKTEFIGAVPGWSSPEGTFRWVEGLMATIYFEGSEGGKVYQNIRFRAWCHSSLGQTQNFLVSVNGMLDHVFTASSEWSEFSWAVPNLCLTAQNSLVIRASRSGSSEGDPRQLSIAFEAFYFE